MDSLSTTAAKDFLGESLTTLNRGLGFQNFSVEELDYIGGGLHAAVKRRRNSLLPIQDAPVEILERIFQFVVAPLPVDRQMRVRKPPQIAWALSLARVCSQWRTIVLRSPKVWYHVIDDSGLFKARPRDMNPNIPLEVSPTSLLHVYITLPQHLRPSSLPKDVEPCRAREVYLRIDKRNHPNMIYRYLASSLPAQTQLLAITSTRDSAQCESYSYPRDLPLVFGGDSLNFRALVADAHAPFLPGNAFPNLVNLRVSCLPHMAVGYTLLLQLFSHTPRLETLELLLHPTRPRGYKEWMEATDGAKGLSKWNTRVCLPYLRALTVSGLYVKVAMTMLSKLDVPSRVIIRLCKLQSHEKVPTLPMIPAFRNLEGLTQMDIFDGFRYEDEDEDADQDEDEEYEYDVDQDRTVNRGQSQGADSGEVRDEDHDQNRDREDEEEEDSDSDDYDEEWDGEEDEEDYIQRTCRPRAQEQTSLYVIGHGSQSGLWIHVEFQAGEDPMEGILQSLQDELPLGNVTSLRMSVLPDRLSCLSAMMSRMSSLTTLTLRSTWWPSVSSAQASLKNISKALKPRLPGPGAALTPAPNLSAVNIEVLSEGSILPKPLVDMAARRVISGVPLVSMTCVIPGAPQQELLRISEHLMDGRVNLARDSLHWDPAEVLTPVWMVTNDYWDMHPPRPASKDAWCLPETLSCFD